MATLKETIQLIRDDNKRAKYSSFFINIFTPPFLVVFWLRIVNYLSGHLIYKPLYWCAYLIFNFYKLLTGIQLYEGTVIGGGFRCFHYSCIVIARKSIIGKNCSVHQGVTIGKQFGGNNYGFPIIGDNCIIFAGAKILGSITIGNNVIIGANSVVLSSIPDNCIVVGNPGRIVSYNSLIALDPWDRHQYFKL